MTMKINFFLPGSQRKELRNVYRFSLERYAGRASRFACPACGAKKRFVRYIDSESGRHIADDVGRCDREQSCGYHKTPREYFEANGGGWLPARKAGISWQGPNRKNRSQGVYEPRFPVRKAGYVDKRYLLASLRAYEQNAFVQFLLKLFPFVPEDVTAAVNEYLIGTGRNGETIFWQIDAQHRIRTGKLILYDPATGRRRKDVSPNWIHSALKRAGQLETFELKQCFFGEHLLAKFPGRAIAVVESEKSAVIASICKAVFPEMVWLASGGLSNLRTENLARIAKDRKVILFPDAGCFDKWQRIASKARQAGITVEVSDLLEIRATDAQKREGLDLADYLIDEQRKRNDPLCRETFRDLIQERLAILTIDGGLSEQEAEHAIITSGFYESAIRTATAGHL